MFFLFRVRWVHAHRSISSMDGMDRFVETQEELVVTTVVVLVVVVVGAIVVAVTIAGIQ